MNYTTEQKLDTSLNELIENEKDIEYQQTYQWLNENVFLPNRTKDVMSEKYPKMFLWRFEYDSDNNMTVVGCLENGKRWETSAIHRFDFTYNHATSNYNYRVKPHSGTYYLLEVSTMENGYQQIDLPLRSSRQFHYDPERELNGQPNPHEKIYSIYLLLAIQRN